MVSNDRSSIVVLGLNWGGRLIAVEADPGWFVIEVFSYETAGSAAFTKGDEHYFTCLDCAMGAMGVEAASIAFCC